MAYSKNIEWRYEKELRQAFNLASLTKRALDNGTPGYFMPVPSAAIVSVSLGARCPAGLIGSICTVLQQVQLAHVRLHRAVLHETEFRIVFERFVDLQQ